MSNLPGTTRSVSAVGRLRVRPFGGVFQLKNTFGVGTDGGTHYNEDLPQGIPAKADVRVQGIGSANGVIMNARFSILLVDG